MKIPEFCQTLEKALGEQADPEGRLRLVVTALQQAFKVRDDEVAIFRLDPESQDLCFLWPKKLVKSGRVPITTRDSLLARTARDAKPLLDNRFPNTRHASIFEKVNLGDPKAKEKAPALPIQKIMSVPMLQAGQVAGVVQLSRKGLDGDAAGPDFSPAELEAFAYIVSAVSRHLVV
ncbi:MAG: GAF domain-containing protein [Deltaproteobacteria bacterium]|nr:MAG: GAF domain-containing protein [Deltaproteobacteria bacterium]